MIEAFILAVGFASNTL